LERPVTNTSDNVYTISDDDSDDEVSQSGTKKIKLSATAVQNEIAKEGNKKAPAAVASEVARPESSKIYKVLVPKTNKLPDSKMKTKATNVVNRISLPNTTDIAKPPKLPAENKSPAVQPRQLQSGASKSLIPAEVHNQATQSKPTNPVKQLNAIHQPDCSDAMGQVENPGFTTMLHVVPMKSLKPLETNNSMQKLKLLKYISTIPKAAPMERAEKGNLNTQSGSIVPKKPLESKEINHQATKSSTARTYERKISSTMQLRSKNRPKTSPNSPNSLNVAPEGLSMKPATPINLTALDVSVRNCLKITTTTVDKKDAKAGPPALTLKPATIRKINLNQAKQLIKGLPYDMGQLCVLKIPKILTTDHIASRRPAEVSQVSAETSGGSKE
jgi:hypothetical protein